MQMPCMKRKLSLAAHGKKRTILGRFSCALVFLFVDGVIFKA